MAVSLNEHLYKQLTTTQGRTDACVSSLQEIITFSIKEKKILFYF